jgi:hypothetical protein
MKILATPRTSALVKAAALAAISGAIVSTMATASWAQTRQHRNAVPAASDTLHGGNASAPTNVRPSGQCLQDEGQGRFTPCDGGGDAG